MLLDEIGGKSTQNADENFLIQEVGARKVCVVETTLLLQKKRETDGGHRIIR